MSLYDKLKDGDTFVLEPVSDGLFVWKEACCDCGLVHLVVIKVLEDGNIEMWTKRNERSTAQMRRHGNGDLLNGHKTWKMDRKF